MFRSVKTGSGDAFLRLSPNEKKEYIVLII